MNYKPILLRHQPPSNERGDREAALRPLLCWTTVPVPSSRILYRRWVERERNANIQAANQLEKIYRKPFALDGHTNAEPTIEPEIEPPIFHSGISGQSFQVSLMRR